MPPAEKPVKTQICDWCHDKATTVTTCPEIREWDNAAEIYCLRRQGFTKGKTYWACPTCSDGVVQPSGVQWNAPQCLARHKREDEERAATAAKKVAPAAAKATAAAHLQPGQAEMQQHGSGTAESATTAAPAHAVTSHPASTQVLSSTGTELRCQKQLFKELEQELKAARATLDKLTFKFREFEEMLSGDGVNEV